MLRSATYRQPPATVGEVPIRAAEHARKIPLSEVKGTTFPDRNVRKVWTLVQWQIVAVHVSQVWRVGSSMTERILALAALLTVSFVTANAHALEGKFRGQYVCEKLPTTADILRVPIDLMVDGSKVQFARPLFNLNGTRVVGSEIAAGTIDADGRVRLTSQWSYLGNTADAEYSGKLTPTGGTFIGTQTWRGPGANPVRRSCTVALVPAPKFATVTEPQRN